ncbi:lipopolysaccharide assembly protein LapA domain-containing protein [Carnobacterium gallinarum]|uniref:LapA family protein n=1 Tax=Carnobacterium gallinarum TaxID=2749 RepID=UPI0005546DBF|nr:LapA family protein [Carnobacterium gallinarum]
MKNQWRLVVGIILVLIVALFAILNVAAVPVNFGFAKVEWPLIMIILGSLFIGAIVTVLVSTGSSIQTKKRLKNAENELNQQQAKLDEEVSKVQSEMESRIVVKDEELAAQQSKIQALEDELVSKITAPITLDK